MTKTQSEFAATSPAPSPAPVAIGVELFLALVAAEGHVRRAAERAGLTMEGVAKLERTDATFKQRFKDARAMRRYLIRDALFEEGVLGVESVDAVNGKVTRRRNVSVLVALAKKEAELDHDRPATAVQITNQQAAPALPVNVGKAVLAELYAEAARRHALPRPVDVIDATVVDDAAEQEL